MEPEFYLKKHHILTYVEDAVTFLLERKDEDPKTKPFSVLADYFKSIRTGTHILFREYAFVSATPHNRLSFLRVFWQSYTEIASQGEVLRVVDYHSLLRLLCHDFPIEIVEKVGWAIFNHNSMETMITFPDFLYMFQVVFVYEHFLSRCKELCSTITTGHWLLKTTMVVSVPSFAEQDPSSSSRPASGVDEERVVGKREGDSIDADVFLKAVTSVIQQMSEREPWHSCLSVEAVTEALIGVQLLSFCDFIQYLSRSEQVNNEIGVLPAKTSSSSHLSK